MSRYTLTETASYGYSEMLGWVVRHVFEVPDGQYQGKRCTNFYGANSEQSARWLAMILKGSEPDRKDFDESWMEKP